MEVDHTGKRRGSTHTSQEGVWCWPVALLWSQREAGLGRMVERCGQRFFAHAASRWGCGAAAGARDVCRIHSIRTRLLAANLMVRSGCGWCNSMTPHRGLAVNYTLESRVAVCAAVGRGRPRACHALRVLVQLRREVQSRDPLPAPSRFQWPGRAAPALWCHGVCSRVGLLPTAWVL